MRRTNPITILFAGALAFLVSWGSTGCLITAFDLPVELSQTALWCALFSAGLAVGFGTKLWLLPLGALTLTGGYLWQKGVLRLSVMRLLHDISECYNRAYSCGVLFREETGMTGADMTTGVLAAGALICIVMTWTICRRRRAWLAVPMGLAPLALCLVVTDTVPEPMYLFLLFLGLGLLMLTQTVRRREETQGNRLTGMLAVPLALALALLFLAVPQETYDRQMGGAMLYQRFLDLCDTVSGEMSLTAEGPGWYTGEAGETVALSDIGPKFDRYTPVMDVTAQTSGTLYLRGRAYDTYDGRSWSASNQSWQWDSAQFWGYNGNLLGDVTVTTRNLHTVRYLPYNVSDDTAYQEMLQGKLDNGDSSLSYTFTQVEAPAPDSFITYDGIREYPFDIPADQYLALPEETRQRAIAFILENIPQCGNYLAGIEYREYMGELLSSRFPGDSDADYSFLEFDENGIPVQPEDYDVLYGMDINLIRQELLQAITDYVRNSAAYSLATPQMPEAETDFALWFLEDSDTGYCVHYATAATVLLRAAGFQARYVSGYLVQTRENRTVTVREKDAHAWVEVYLPTCGWMMLEVTAGIGDQAVEETTVPVTTAQTTAPSQSTTAPTEAITQPEEIHDSTQPGDTAPQPPDLSWLRTALKVLLGIALALGLIIGQWKLRLRLRFRQMHRGPANAQALARWKETERLCRLLKQKPGPDLLELAQKAKFSRHTLTRDELARFDEAISNARSLLRQKPVYERIIHRLIFAAY